MNDLPRTGSCPETREALARLDERLKALTSQLGRAEEAAERALKLASDELARRLDTLNHAHSEAIRVQGTYVPREVFESAARENARALELALREVNGRLGTSRDELRKLDGEFREQRGRLWLPMLAAAAAAAGLTAAALKLLVQH